MNKYFDAILVIVNSLVAADRFPFDLLNTSGPNTILPDSVVMMDLERLGFSDSCL